MAVRLQGLTAFFIDTLTQSVISQYQLRNHAFILWWWQTLVGLEVINESLDRDALLIARG